VRWEASPRAAPRVVAELAELDVGQRQALGQCVGVLERDRARVGEGQARRAHGAAARAAEHALQGGDLLRYRGLGQRQVTRRRVRTIRRARRARKVSRPARIQH
jgi:hypothetical protein